VGLYFKKFKQTYGGRIVQGIIWHNSNILVFRVITESFSGITYQKVNRLKWEIQSRTPWVLLIARAQVNRDQVNKECSMEFNKSNRDYPLFCLKLI